MGPETKRALAEFQKSNGLEQTATLDQQTADALIGDPGSVGQGSGLPPRSSGSWNDDKFSARAILAALAGKNRSRPLRRQLALRRITWGTSKCEITMRNAGKL